MAAIAMNSTQDRFYLSAQHPVLRDHVVHGRHVLPGLAYIDLLYQALREQGLDHRGWSLRNVSIYHPLSLAAGDEFLIELDGRQLDDATWRIEIHGQDTQAGGPRRRYCSAQIVATEPVRFDETLDLEAVLAAGAERTPLDLVYRQCREHGLVHGGFMQPRGARYATADAIYIDCAVDPAFAHEGMELMFHPALLDGCAIGVGSVVDAPGDGALPLFLPIAIESFRASQLLSDRCVARIRTQSMKFQHDLCSLTLEFFDERGAKVAELKNLTTKAVRDPGLLDPSPARDDRAPAMRPAATRVTQEPEPTPAAAGGDELRRQLEAFLQRIVAQRLGVAADQVDARAGFYDLGLDSASLLELVQLVEGRLQVPLSPTLLFEYTNVRDLAGHLSAGYGAQWRDADRPRRADVATPQRADAGTVAAAEAPRAGRKPAPHAGGDETDIAIIGMAGRFPQAADVRELWANLLAAKDCITEVPASRWDWHLLDAVKSASGKDMSRWGGFIADADCFDAEFFRIVPRDAEMMDPQERQFLEVAWAAIEDAGYTPATLVDPGEDGRRRAVGVFAGAMHKDYALVGVQRLQERQVLPLSLSAGMIANRVSYFCNFHGPSITVDTVCSSSLTAVHLALESVRHGECGVALAGGVNLSLHPAKYLTYGMADMHASDGRCRSFGAGGDGYVSAESVGVVVLKPLRQALADRDAVYAVVKGSTVNHVGAVGGASVPSPTAQADMIVQCLRKTGIDARTIGYVEAHGTGTSLGDPIEIEGLGKAFRHDTQDVGFCAIGSLKSNIGHAEAAAGVAGLIKAALQLEHRVLVASLHAQTLNPHIDWQRSPFVVQTRTEKWRRPKRRENGRVVTYPRRAALSSFGATGSNAHVILEEFRAPHETPDFAEPAVVVLSARNAERLRAQAQRLLAHLERDDVPLADLAYTLQVGREAFDHRLAIVAADTAQLKSRLASFAATGAARTDDDCFVGECRQYRDAVGLLTDDEDSAELVAKWLAKGKLRKIAQLWIKGFIVDWTRLYGAAAPRRVHLPGYAFARPRYWLPDAEPAPAVDPAPVPTRSVAMPAATTSGALLLTPQWEPAAAVSSVPVAGEHWILFAGWPAAASVDAWPSARVDALADSGGDHAERIEHYGWQLLQRVQAWLQGRPRTPLLIQVVIPAGDETLYALAGLLKTARLEQPLLRGQVIGVASISDATLLVSQLAQSAASDAAELRCTATARHARTYRPLPASSTSKHPWKRDGVYLITGGGGGLGRIVAEAIGRDVGTATVVLVGRSAPRDVPQVPGLTVDYRQADVADAAAVEQLVATIVARYGRLDGIVHSAGVIRDGFLLRKSAAQYRDVLAPKVRGVVNLDRATRHLALDAFVLFSSATGAHGNVGQGDYALANAFLDAYAHERAQAVARGECRGRTVSIGWPLWADGGMQVSAERRDALRALGADAMPTAQGLQVLYDAYGSGAAQVQVLYGTTPAAVTIAAAPVTAWHGEASELKPRTLQQLQRLFGAVTKLDASQIDVAEPLESYGIDSILIMQLNQRLTGIFGELSKTLFFEYPTLAELGEFLVREHRAACERWCGMDAPAVATVSSAPTPVAAPARLVAPAPQMAAPIVPAVPASRAIAVIGLAGRYPQARDVDAYWDNLRDGRDGIVEIPAERWPLAGFFEADMERAIATGRSYGKWGGFVDGFAEFDALFFNISPREAMNLDPQERLFLETCWAAMEDAGYTRERFASAHQRRVGVFAGITKTGFDLYGPELWRRGELVAPLTSFGSLANRVSYVLNLQGPSMPVDTMCSASLTAIHEACEHLLRDECELAFAGGVNLYLHPSNYAMLCSSRMLSASGRCHTFGTGGDGFVPGEGVGAVLLKPLATAIADRDPIHGVIRATGINHDGKTNGYTVPNPVAQRDLIASVLTKAGIDARSVSYIEAHGTGTSLGDPIEITGLTQAFARHTTDTQFCAIGSAKSNIGHLESAAGIAGLTKVLLQMQHRQLAPSLHAETLNPNIDFTTTPFVVQRALTAWHRPQVTIDGVTTEHPRIAGISSFGAGGANAHVIVEEYVAPVEAPFALARPAVVVLSARSEERLKAHAQQLLDAIAKRALGDADLANLAYTLQIGREAMEQRLAFTASTMAALIDRLQRYVAGDAAIEGLHRGEVKRNKEALSVFTEDDELHEAIAKWLDRGKYGKVLGLWVKGLAVDWTRLYPHGTPRVIALPTYPFARELYWFGNLTQTTIADVIAMSPGERAEPQPSAPEAGFAPVQRNAGKPSVSLRALSNAAAPRADVPKPEPVREPEPVAAPVAPVVQPAPPRVETIEARPAAAAVVSVESIAESLTESLAKALFIERKNISNDDVFVELGLDSIVGVEWTHVINRTYGLALPATRLYDYPTIRDLTAYVAGELGKRPAPAAAVESKASVPASDVASGAGERPAASSPAAFAPAAAATTSPQPTPPPPAVTAPQNRAVTGLLEGIAIIGMSARYPHASDVDEFWRNIASGRDCVDEVPRERWSVDDYYDGSGETLGTTYCRTMGAVADVAQFDPLFFGIAPSEAYVMDPQQRLFLQACWECIEDAAIDATALAGTRCAVFAGCGAGDYGTGPEAASAQGLIGGSSSILAARISYFLDLKGPCLAIDTACSSSLVAIASACDSLVLGQSEMALAGGVCVLCGPAIHVTTSNAGMLSKTGRCFAFDQRADGFVPAEGVGVVLLKRLGDALRDRDRIHGVIRGWGVNQDGKTNGITAPSVKSQIALERDVYERFGIDPRTITLVEAHGTGTKLGDPIEVEALVAAFDVVRGDAAPAQNYCALGSVKSNIGHALTAAAVASIVKVLLAMRHRQLPPTLHFERLNEHIDLRGTPFYVNDRLRDWNVPANVPRRAAVSSFGFSGTNAHCVIEEAPLPTCQRVSRPGHLIVLSAKTAPQLREQALRLAAHCERHALDCADVSYTLLAGRKHFGHRLACVVGDTRELCFTLERWARRGEAEGVVTGELEGGIGNDAAIREYGNRSIAESRTERDSAAYLRRLSSIAELYVQGHALDYAGLFAADECCRISLPAYPFAREHYWFSSPAPAAPAAATAAAPPDAPLSGIVDAVMQGTLDVGSAAAQLRRLVDEADGEHGGYDRASDHAGANGHHFNGRVT